MLLLLLRPAGVLLTFFSGFPFTVIFIFSFESQCAGNFLLGESSCHIWKITLRMQNVESLHMRAIQGHVGARVPPNFFPRQATRRNYSISVSQSTTNHHCKRARTRGRQAVHARQPLDKKPTKKNKACKHFKSHHDSFYVVDMEDAQKQNLKFYQTINGRGICFGTIPKEYTKVIHIRDRDTNVRIRVSVSHMLLKRTPVTTSWSQTRKIPC